MKIESMTDDQIEKATQELMAKKQAIHKQQLALNDEWSFRMQRNAFEKAGGDPALVQRPVAGKEQRS